MINRADDIQMITDFLENSYTGARAMNDPDAMIRISRAIAALQAPTDMEIFNIRFRKWHFNETFKPPALAGDSEE